MMRSPILSRAVRGFGVTVGLAAFVAVMSTARLGFADPIPETSSGILPSTTAESLFRSGRDAMQRADYDRACSDFAESDRIEPSPGAKLNLALCEQQRGHLALAWSLLQSVAQALPQEDERGSIARRHMAEVFPRLAFVTLRLPRQHPRGARVVVDGTELSLVDVGRPLALQPGPHVIGLRAPGYVATSREISLQAGDQQRFDLVLGQRIPMPGAGLGEHPRKRNGEGTVRTVGWVLEGSAGGLLLLSTVTGIMALNAKRSMESTCDARGNCSPEGLRAAARGEAFSSVSTASFIGAGTAAVVGAVLLLVNFERPGPVASGVVRGLRAEF